MPFTTEGRQLTQMLRRPHPGMRYYALQRLADIADRSTLPAVRKATEDDDPSVASQAERTLYCILHELAVAGHPGESSRQLAGEAVLNRGITRVGQDLLKPHVSWLSDQLRREGAHLARASAVALGRIGNPDAIPVLVERLADPRVRAACAFALAELESDQAEEALLRLLDSQDRDAVRVGVFCLVGRPSPQVREKMLSLLDHPDSVIRVDAIFVVPELGHQDASARLLPLLDDRSEEVVVRTLGALRRLPGSQGLRDAIVDRFQDAASERVRASFIAAMEGAPADGGVVGILERALSDTDPRVRANAVEVLGSISLPKARKLRLLRPLQRDENNRVLGNLAVALGELDSVLCLEVLSRMLNSSDKWVRASAVYAAGFIEEERVGHWLANTLLFEEDPDVLRNTVSSLCRCSHPSVLEQVTRATRHYSPTVRAGAAWVLAEAGQRRSLQYVEDAIGRERDPDVRAEMLAAGGPLWDTSHIPMLTEALADEDPRVQASALEALEHFGSVEILPAVKPLLRSRDARVKALAARAMWKLGDLTIPGVIMDMLESSDHDLAASAVQAAGELGGVLRYAARSGRFYLLTSALEARAVQDEPPEAAPLPSVAQQTLSQFRLLQRPLEEMIDGEYSRAVNSLLQIERKQRGGAAVHFLLGDLYRKLENHTLADRYLERARHGDPGMVNADLQQAALQQMLGRPRNSIGAYLRAMETKLEVMREQVRIARQLLDEDRIGDSSLLLRSLVAQMPLDSRLHLRVGQQLVEHGLFEEALQHVFRALLVDPRQPRVLFHMAILASRMDHIEEARLALQLLRRLDGDAPALAAQLEHLLGEGPPPPPPPPPPPQKTKQPEEPSFSRCEGGDIPDPLKP